MLEIVGGRRLGPTLGVSLYTWPSMIGVVLAGVSLGNYWAALGSIAGTFLAGFVPDRDGER